MIAELVVMATGLSRSPAEALYDDVYSAMYRLLPFAKIPLPRMQLEESINSLGFRGPEISVQKPPRTMRIVCIGDSTTFGHTLPYNQTYSALLQNRLAPSVRPRSLQVINADVPGTSLPQHIFHFENHILPLSPDVVVVQTVADVNGPRLRALDELRRQLRGQETPSRTRRILRHSHLYRALRRLIKGDPHRGLRSNMEQIVTMAAKGKFKKSIFDHLREDLATLADLCARHDVYLVLQLPVVGPQVERMAAAGELPGTPMRTWCFSQPKTPWPFPSSSRACAASPW